MLFAACASVAFSVALLASEDALGLLRLSSLVAILGTAAFSDIRSRRIPNWLTYGAFVWALLLLIISSVVQPELRNTPVGFDTSWGLSLNFMSIDVASGLSGAACCFSILLILYSLNLSGAGDVKLAAVIGLNLGVGSGMQAILWTYITAGGAVAVYVVVRYGVLQMTAMVLEMLHTESLGPITKSSPRSTEIQNQSVPLAVFLALGTLIVIFTGASL